jgi:hypothetical protein
MHHHPTTISVFDQTLLLLGNCKLNTSMDTLDSPTATHGYMATENGRPQEKEGHCFYWDS